MAGEFLKCLDAVLGVLGETSHVDFLSQRLMSREKSHIDSLPQRLMSGGFNVSPSVRWQACGSIIRDQFWLFVQQLRNHGLDLFLVLVKQREHVAEYRLLHAFDLLGRAWQNRVATQASVYGASLTSSPAKQAGLDEAPPLPELARAFEQLRLWFELRHAQQTGLAPGKWQGETEWQSSADAAAESCAGEDMLQSASAYFAAIHSGDREGWLELFAEHARSQHLGDWFDRWQQWFCRIESCQSEPLAAAANRLQVRWTLAGTSFLQGAAEVSGEQLFEFDGAARIVATTAKWEPEALASQWLESHQEARLEAIDRLD